MENRQLVIIGAGPAGLTAAIYGRRAGLDTLVLERGLFGGAINSTADVENYPALKRTEGMALAKSLREHAEMFGPELRECGVESVSIGGNGKIIRTDKGDVSAEALIIATGTSFSRIGCKGEDRFAGRGVSYCAVCDGAFYEGASVVVVGGGNAAVEEAEYLTRFASKVHIVHRREEFRADVLVVERALANPKIEPVLGYTVDEIAGGDMVEQVVLKNVKTLETKTIPAEGVFIFIGMKPELGFLDGAPGIKRAQAGWIIADDKMETSEEGVFAAGDVREKFLRQIVTATADGAIAAMAAYEYVSNLHYLESALFGRPHAYALLISGIDPGHLAIVQAAEEWKKSSQTDLAIIDVYRAGRIKAKLGVSELPSVAEISGGRAVRTSRISSVGDVKGFMAEAPVR
ncbi:MAG: FAD-dependent oxidoreductase [Synergistaceae bacterium]|jgi:thioredoxin reductase (NADPH)|nr:FAD-dependent oxidoreductase [Synergistaceae bacterium]